MNRALGIFVAALVLSCFPLSLIAEEAVAESARPIPSLAELEANGAVIGEIRIDNQNIFDLDDPQENSALFRAANFLHIRTRPAVIRRILLFKTGEPLSVRLIDETERLIRNNRFIYDVNIQATAYHDGIVDLQVVTRDTWSLNPGVNFSRAGGTNSSGLTMMEMNVLGTGTRITYAKTSNIDRTGQEFSISDDHTFDGWTALGFSHATNSDGSRTAASVAHPFYAMDTRWAAAVSGFANDRVESVYSSGQVIAQYRVRQTSAESYAGWSAGLQDGWVHRYSAGLQLRDTRHVQEPGTLAIDQLPEDSRLASPFLRYEVIEDRIDKVRNRNQIGRPEYFGMGYTAGITASRSSTALGSTHNKWIVSVNSGKGFEPAEGDAIIAATKVDGQYGERGFEHFLASTSATYYHPHGGTSLFFASLKVDILRHNEPHEVLQLGGDNGLRGFPLRYQTGKNLVLATVENRFYTDWYPFRLFRAGGAAFADLGRAWSSSEPGGPGEHWLGDLGFGLRLASVRAAFGNVLHADIAFPVSPDPNIKKVQFLLRTKISY